MILRLVIECVKLWFRAFPFYHVCLVNHCTVESEIHVRIDFVNTLTRYCFTYQYAMQLLCTFLIMAEYAAAVIR